MNFSYYVQVEMRQFLEDVRADVAEGFINIMENVQVPLLYQRDSINNEAAWTHYMKLLSPLLTPEGKLNDLYHSVIRKVIENWTQCTSLQ